MHIPQWFLGHMKGSQGVYRQAEVSTPVREPKYVADRHPMRIVVFRLPAELIVELLSHFGNPHHNVRREKLRGTLVLEHVERLTATRKLTMTCWHLRNMLFPLLWEYVEGCNLSSHIPAHNHGRPHKLVPLKSGLYDQCLYLIHNPAVCAYVQYVCSCNHSKKNSPGANLQGPLCGSALYGYHERLDDEICRLPGSAAQPKNLGHLRPWQHRPHKAGI